MRALNLFSVLSLLALGTAATSESPRGFHVEPTTLKLQNGSRLAAEEGTLVVPANRAKDDGKTVELHFVRIPGAAGGTPTLYLAGGPGEEATGLLRARQAPTLIAAFRAIGDFILLDQRGTGRSQPFPVCRSSEPLPDYAFTDGVAMEKRAREAVARCAAEWAAKGVDPSAFNSRDAADDLDDLRRALGAEKINLVGFSYGTHLALAAMRRHSDHLGRVVLLGTEGPDHTYKLPSTLDRQLRKLSSLAAEDPAINAQVPDMMALLHQVLAQLDKEPVTVTVHDRARDRDVPVRVSKWGLLRILRWDVGDGNDFVVFPALLYGIAHGDLSLLSRYVEKRWNQLGRGLSLMPIATDCSAGVSAERSEQIRAESGGSIFGEVTNFPFPGICEALGNPDAGAEMRAPLASSVPTLFISGTLDSNTPPFQAEEVRWGLTHATHLIVDNAGHEDTQPMPEVQRAIFDFLSGKDVGDRHIARPRPKFLSLAAAKDFRPY